MYKMPSVSKYRIPAYPASPVAVGAVGNMIDRIERLDYVVDFPSIISACIDSPRL